MGWPGDCGSSRRSESARGKFWFERYVAQPVSVAAHHHVSRFQLFAIFILVLSFLLRRSVTIDIIVNIAREWLGAFPLTLLVASLRVLGSLGPCKSLPGQKTGRVALL